MNQRNVIFISHATPEDNDFTIWLASRLMLLGYEVWIDKRGLIGGEKFWQEIDQTIRNRAIKVLLVYSQNICQKDDHGVITPGILKDGVSKEYSLAESIGKQNGLSDFIILMNIDGSTYNLFIGADRLNQIPFYDNWAQGFKQLEKKLIKDQISKNSEIGNFNFSEWYEKEYVVTNGITSKQELYYSNWWPINSLPEFFFIYQFKTQEQANTVYKQNKEYPLSKIANHLCSFESKTVFEVTHQNMVVSIKPAHIFQIKLSNVFMGVESSAYPSLRDSENHFKKLLSRVFHLLMDRRDLLSYEMATKQRAYFFTPYNLESLKVKFEYPYRTQNKTKTKNLIGRYKSLGNWHYAVSGKTILSPILAFSLKSHITFTTNGFKVWKNDKNEIDTDKIHSQRRAKGKRMFNEEWRDLLMAFINGLKKDDKIQIELSSSFTLEMPHFTESYKSDFGYYDPDDKSRHGILAMYEFEEEEEIVPEQDND